MATLPVPLFFAKDYNTAPRHMRRDHYQHKIATRFFHGLGAAAGSSVLPIRLNQSPMPSVKTRMHYPTYHGGFAKAKKGRLYVLTKANSADQAYRLFLVSLDQVR